MNTDQVLIRNQSISQSHLKHSIVKEKLTILLFSGVECFFALHKWSEWESYYDNSYYRQRICKKCHVSQKFIKKVRLVAKEEFVTNLSDIAPEFRGRYSQYYPREVYSIWVIMGSKEEQKFQQKNTFYKENGWDYTIGWVESKETSWKQVK